MDLSLERLRALIAQSGQQELIVNLVCIIGILIALANCFAGYRLLHVWILLLGAGLGAFLGYGVCSFFAASAIVQAISILVIALLFALLAHHFRTAGCVLLCAAMAFSFSYYFLLYRFGYGDIKTCSIIAAVIGVLCGALSYLIKKPAIILITALCGSYTAWSTISDLFGIYYNQRVHWMAIGAIALFGLIAQVASSGKK